MSKLADCILDHAISAMIGHRYRLAGLTSERGRALNGRLVKVEGRQNPPGTRMIVRFVDDPAAAGILVERLNLQLPDCGNFDGAKPDPIPEADLRQMFAAAVKDFQGFGRPDIAARIALIQHHLKGNELGQIRCMDVMWPEDTDDPLMRCLQSARLACTGTGYVSFPHFNEGLLGNGTVCTICLEQVLILIFFKN